ncbi:MAG: Minf_1886 family protein [Planctomycetota bacterium]
MSAPPDVETAIRELCTKDPRYGAGAYFFLLEALEFTMRMLKRDSNEGAARHVGGRELLEGIRQYAILQFGPLAPIVFESYGIRRTEDFGALVFRLVEAGHLSRQEGDSVDDFADGYDFKEAFLYRNRVSE